MLALNFSMVILCLLSRVAASLSLEALERAAGQADPLILSNTGVEAWEATSNFLAIHPEWALQGVYLYGEARVVMKRRRGALPSLGTNHLVLCTGPSFQRRQLLKMTTENDLRWVKFKQIFFSTNDLNLMNIDFSGQRPKSACIERLNHQLDCVNCILNSISRAANSSEVEGGDILLFKHESVFINDIDLVGKCIEKIQEGYDAVVRTDDYGLDMTDVFFIKASSARKLFANRRGIVDLGKFINCEDYFTQTVFNQLPKVYRVRTYRKYGHWEDNELGFFHILPVTRSDRIFWDKKNYDTLFTNF